MVHRTCIERKMVLRSCCHLYADSYQSVWT